MTAEASGADCSWEQERARVSVLQLARQRGSPPATVYWWRSRIWRKAAAQTELVAVDVVGDHAKEDRVAVATR